MTIATRGLYRRRSLRAFSPLDLAPFLWFDAKDPGTMFTDINESTQSTNGTSVGRWKDKAGGSLHADQLTGSAMPTLNTTGLNSRPALSFDGGDLLLTPSVAALAGRSNLEIWVVGQSASAMTEIFCETTSVAGDLGCLNFHTGSARMAGTIGNTGLSQNNNDPGNTLPHVCRAHVDRSLAALEASCHLDGGARGATQPANNNNTSNMAASTVSIGARSTGAFALVGFVSEVLVLPALTAPQAASLADYLRAKWGTP